ncbi:TIGR03960 family B12-binding radical SAM protein [Salidesulfovibrio onnuriiensis]|uniref:TIGR03960 family B12-binding radical SAM protein n=1 Tax=Salidesulfovibrio onnuriiensis TaxID=2583823 RepID=UPI0011C9F13B|nr:TIGR03960 family B12-binding radical SAM protein [Salidesulfovibrio onnuriiensis]
MKELLPILPKPTRYIGSEWGAVYKDKESVRVHMALAFPDMYEIGMSYLGQKILLKQINDREAYWAERVYTPCRETAAIMREHGVRLSTLESDTPLTELDIIGFSLTHELCYTNILYMLDLAGIPFRSEARDESHPLIVAGGGACFNAEPVAPFFDAMIIGDGEETQIQMLEVIEQAKAEGLSRNDLLLRLKDIPGVYIPSFFENQGPGQKLKPLVEGYETVEKAVVEDLNTIPFPTEQLVSFGQAVHDRLTLEIARGCTRGCRFCQAGMIYRPVRERGLEELENILAEGLAKTGYEETSFLSLSTGDYSALDTLFSRCFDRCAAEQISISLPSLRVGSLSAPIMERISSIRRTGATLAPEAGSQRLRDAINKGVDEEGLLDHIRLIFDHGWQSVKLYFMIGLPTETDEDLEAILDLCLKARDAVGKHIKRLQITAAVSPFVPKPHTPFQWEPQIPLDEIKRRIYLLKDLFRPHKRVQLKFHIPEMTFLEGIFSRGDRRLAPVVEKAYAKDALFSSWKDQLAVAPYLEALEECGLTPEEYTGGRDMNAPLPWDHLNSGLTRKFLLTERERALGGKITKDCRYNTCRQCGVCESEKSTSALLVQKQTKDIRQRLVLPKRDQEGEQPPFVKQELELGAKGGHYRIWYEKTGPAAYLSQLELQSVFERALRRANLPVSFSQGFHPMPRMSFGKALPVSVESTIEWFNLFLREDWGPKELAETLGAQMPRGLRLYRADRLDMGKKQPQSVEEDFRITFAGDAEEAGMRMAQWKAFMANDSVIIERTNKKGKIKPVDIRKLVRDIDLIDDRTLTVTFDWREGYISPLRLLDIVNEGIGPLDFGMTKTAQRF